MKYTLGLCEPKRGYMPVEGYIFPQHVDGTNVGEMLTTAYRNIPVDATEIDLYVSGYTPAILAVVNICQSQKITLVAYNYDKGTDSYVKQPVLYFTQCPYCGTRYSIYDNQCSACFARTEGQMIIEDK